MAYKLNDKESKIRFDLCEAIEGVWFTAECASLIKSSYIIERCNYLTHLLACFFYELEHDSQGTPGTSFIKKYLGDRDV